MAATTGKVMTHVCTSLCMCVTISRDLQTDGDQQYTHTYLPHMYKNTKI